MDSSKSTIYSPLLWDNAILSSMSSQNVYTPLAQGYATFANVHTTIGSRSDELGDLCPDNQSRTIAKAREVIASNTGLLLVTVSQIFFALVHAAAKKMNSSETPVPVLEVCLEVCMPEEYPQCFFGHSSYLSAW